MMVSTEHRFHNPQCNRCLRQTMSMLAHLWLGFKCDWCGSTYSESVLTLHQCCNGRPWTVMCNLKLCQDPSAMVISKLHDTPFVYNVHEYCTLLPISFLLAYTLFNRISHFAFVHLLVGNYPGHYSDNVLDNFLHTSSYNFLKHKLLLTVSKMLWFP